MGIRIKVKLSTNDSSIPSASYYEKSKEARGKFLTLYADPPWNETGGGVKGGRRGADRHYSLMKTKDICALPVRDIMANDSHCYLWVTNNYLCNGAGFEVLNAWGFTPKTIITWGKDKMGIGQYFRGQTEHVIFGVRGCLPYKILPNGKRGQSTTLLLEPRTTHSTKPESMIERIETVSYAPYVEIFSRQSKYLRPLWTYIGNEITGNDIMIDLKILKEQTDLEQSLFKKGR